MHRTTPALARRRPLLTWALIALALVGAGCTEVRLLGTYDAWTDAQITALHEESAWLFVDLGPALGTPGGAYARFQGRYDSLLVRTDALALRAAAREKNELQVRQVGTLRDQLVAIRDRHREGRLRRAELGPLRRIMNQSFEAVLRLELAKRRDADA